MEASIINTNKAELIRAETALNSFRDSGFSFEDTIGEYCDNSIQASATEFRVSWIVEQDGKKATQRKATSIGIADNGGGVSPNLLSHCLTIGFGTRLNDRNGIGKYGVGFKLATLNQAQRLTVYSRPRYLKAEKNLNEEGTVTWTFSEPNLAGRIFKTYFDLEEIISGTQQEYMVEEVNDFPAQYSSLMKSVDGKPYSHGCLFILEKLDRFNERKSYAENIDQKFSDLAKFLSRAFRVYIDNGFDIFLDYNQHQPLLPYDPAFRMDNNYKTSLIDSRSREEKDEIYAICEKLKIETSFTGSNIDAGDFLVDGHKVTWSVDLAPKIVRVKEGLGGSNFYRKNDEYFSKLHIGKDIEGKVSFLRQSREINYNIVPKLFPSAIEPLDRYIAVSISFPAYLDEYFQVRHIKRGAEPVDKLRDKIRQVLSKPIIDARKEIRDFWKVNTQAEQTLPSQGNDFSGGRTDVLDTTRTADLTLPKGPGGAITSPAEEHFELKKIAEEKGILDPKEQEAFATKAKQSPIIAIERSWPGKGLIDIRHLTNTVVVYLNSNHAFIKKVYLPLKAACQDNSLPYNVISTLKNAADGIDLLFFAYAKAENQSMDPEEQFGVLREDWGKFASVYLKKLEDIDVR